MEPTEITASAFAPPLAADLTRASVRFTASIAVLIGISLLLASI